MPKRKVGPSPAAPFPPMTPSCDSASPAPVSRTNASAPLRAWFLLVERVEHDQDDLARRTQLMRDLADLLHDPGFPTNLRAEAMALMGRMARRSLDDSPCQRGLVVMRGRFSSRHGRLG